DGAWAAGTTRTLEEAADDALRLLDRATTEAAPQGTVSGPGRERPQPRRPGGISPATGDDDARPMGDAARRTCLRTRGEADGWTNAGGRGPAPDGEGGRPGVGPVAGRGRGHRRGGPAAREPGGRAAAGQVDPGAVPARLGRAAPGPRLHRPPPGPDLAA